MITPSAEAWRLKGVMEEVDGHEIFLIDEGYSHETIVMLHDYPTCSYDFYKVLPVLKNKYRVVLHDHLGFGYSDRPHNYSYSITDQARLTMKLWSKIGLQEVHLVGHGYGALLAAELTNMANEGYEPVMLKSITIINAGLLSQKDALTKVERLKISDFWGPIYERLIHRWTFRSELKKLWSDPSKADKRTLKTLHNLKLKWPKGYKVEPKILRYKLDLQKQQTKWIEGFCISKKDIHCVWSDFTIEHNEREKIEKEVSFSTSIVIPDTGHYPMLESPTQYSQVLASILEQQHFQN